MKSTSDILSPARSYAVRMHSACVAPLGTSKGEEDPVDWTADPFTYFRGATLRNGRSQRTKEQTNHAVDVVPITNRFLLGFENDSDSSFTSAEPFHGQSVQILRKDAAAHPSAAWSKGLVSPSGERIPA
jgi:hypothetical protein